MKIKPTEHYEKRLYLMVFRAMAVSVMLYAFVIFFHLISPSTLQTVYNSLQDVLILLPATSDAVEWANSKGRNNGQEILALYGLTGTIYILSLLYCILAALYFFVFLNHDKSNNAVPTSSKPMPANTFGIGAVFSVALIYLNIFDDYARSTNAADVIIHHLVLYMGNILMLCVMFLGVDQKIQLKRGIE